MQINFTSTQQDYVDAQKAHAWGRHTPAKRRLRQFLLLALGFGLIALGISSYQSRSDLFLVVVQVACGLVVAFAVPVINPLLYRRAYRRSYGTQPYETSITVTRDVIECDCPGRSHSVFEWPVILGATENQTSIILYLAPARFLPIPKRVLSEDQTRELKDLLQTKSVPSRAPRKA